MKNDTKQQLKLGVIFLGRRRPGFDMEWGRKMEERVRGWMKKAGYEAFEASAKVIDDATLRAAMRDFEAKGVQAIVMLQATLGDGRLAPTLAQLWPDPIVLWATPENQEGDMISSCSLVGTHCWASVLRQMGHSFDLVYGDPDAADTQRRFGEAVRLAATVRRLRTFRAGVVGGQAPGYFAMSTDLFSVHRGAGGGQVQTFSLIEFANVVKELDEKAVAADVARVKAMGMGYLRDAGDADLPMASRLYLAMRSFYETENLDALTVRCWPEMSNFFGQWPYLGIARLADEGRAIACEGDADGALIAWLGESLGFGRCYLSDWLEHDAETITTWHIGAAPMSLCHPVGKPGGPKIAPHFNIRKPCVLDATIRDGMPVTLTRLWHRDGEYCLTAREGRTIKPRRHLMGTNSLTRMDNLDPRKWFEELCAEGMPHHIALFQGHHRDELTRLARVAGFRMIA